MLSVTFHYVSFYCLMVAGSSRLIELIEIDRIGEIDRIRKRS